jgi:hypothetical protein
MTASVSHIDVEVRPSIGFQTIGLTARISFDPPVTAEEALFEANLLRDRLNIEAQSGLEVLISQRQEVEATRPTTAAPTPTVVPSGDGWAIGTKPKGAGTFRYLTTVAFPTDRLRSEVAAALSGLGIDGDDVDIYDDRVGKYGLESGNESYQPAKVKVKDGTPLAAALQGKAIVAGVDFNADGSIKVALTKDGRAALQALTIAASLGGQKVEANTPF